MHPQDPNVKLVFFNLDGTLIDGMEFFYQHLWEFFGVDKEKTRTVLKQYISGETDYAHWVENDVRLLREAGATSQGITNAVMNLHPMEGAIETIRAFHERGYKLFGLSSGIDLVVQEVLGTELKNMFEAIFINQYQFDDSGKLLSVTVSPYDVDHKANCVKEAMSRYGAAPSNCVYIGNNETDAAPSLLVGTSIAFNSRSERLVEVSSSHVESDNVFDIMKFVR